ncbi:MAG: hypothetical protein CMO47_00675 [Verrucomicrobiales bacterium]|nr:hypothetical protein [Verrucomicrobiales bacterium]
MQRDRRKLERVVQLLVLLVLLGMQAGPGRVLLELLGRAVGEREVPLVLVLERLPLLAEPQALGGPTVALVDWVVVSELVRDLLVAKLPLAKSEHLCTPLQELLWQGSQHHQPRWAHQHLFALSVPLVQQLVQRGGRSLLVQPCLCGDLSASNLALPLEQKWVRQGWRVLRLLQVQ